MALFYLIAKQKVGDFDWGQIYPRIDTLRHECITIFPISKQIGVLTNSIGITLSSEFKGQIKIVTQELTQLLELLWNAGFEIYDLYKGQIITSQTLKEVMNYL
jgi:hypothetical protein